jgi:nitrite reductase/ring-hydroxylating ferredoxin subunit
MSTPLEAAPHHRTGVRADSLPPGSLVRIACGGRDWVLGNCDGELFALEDSCPHQGGPLSEGELLDRHIVCPWHGWSVEVGSGRCRWAPDSPVATARLRVTAGEIELQA